MSRTRCRGYIVEGEETRVLLTPKHDHRVGFRLRRTHPGSVLHGKHEERLSVVVVVVGAMMW